MKIVVLVGLLLTQVLFADDSVITLTIVGTSQSDDSAKAKNEALKDALDKGSLQVITQLIGSSKTEKNLKAIKARVFPKRASFLQSYKAQEPTQSGKDTSIGVIMKISTTSLKDVLAKEGLLYQSDGPAAILPAFNIFEKRDGGRRFQWWYNEANASNMFLKDRFEDLVDGFDPIFRSKNFYLIDPAGGHYVQWLPEPYRHEYLSSDDLIWMGEFFKSALVIGGDVFFEPGAEPGRVQGQFRLTVYHTNNGRVVAEISRNMEVGPREWEVGIRELLAKASQEIGQDLSRQIADEWNRGVIGATLYKIIVKNLSMPQDQEAFKKQILSKVGDVKKIRERLLEGGKTTFEADITGGAAALGNRLETLDFQGFKLEVGKVDTQSITLNFIKTK